MLERIIIFLVTLGVVVYILIALKIWGDDLTKYFLRTGKWQELVFVTALAYIITTILEKLLQWEFRIQARGRK